MYVRYYLAIKVSLNALKNIYKIRNLAISLELFHILTGDMHSKRKTVIWICQSSHSSVTVQQQAYCRLEKDRHEMCPTSLAAALEKSNYR